MAHAVFRIANAGGKWRVEEEGRTASADYSTREAAFEAAVGSASNAIKEGEEVTLHVEAPLPGQSTRGGPG